jgi:hypothetical protein
MGSLITTPPLGAFSYDDFTRYSPPITVSITNLSIANAQPLLLGVRFDNHERNLQVPLPSLRLRIGWTDDVTPGVKPAPVSRYLYPPADASVVRRGPLLFALHPREEKKVVQTYVSDPPARPLAVDYEISTTERWAFALELESSSPPSSSPSSLAFDRTPSAGWSLRMPFDTDEYPFSIRAKARHLNQSAWGYWAGSRITAQPPPSPFNCSGSVCGASETVRLVPFGGTNIRIAVMPWVAA